MGQNEAPPKHLQRAAMAAIIMVGGIMVSLRAADTDPPSTREKRDDVQQKLEKSKGGLDSKEAEIKKGQAFLAELKVSIEALEKAIAPLTKSAIDKDITDDVTKKLQTSLEELKTKQETWTKKMEAGTIDLGAMRRDFLKTLNEFLENADPQQILDYTQKGKRVDGIGFDSLDTPRYLDRTTGNKKGVKPIVYVAEHDWLDAYGMREITQHQEITTKDIEWVLSKLSGNPDYRMGEVGRVPINVNKWSWDKGPGFTPDGTWKTDASFQTGAFANIYGNKKFRPAAVSNSTGAKDKEMATTAVFDEQMTNFTRVPGKKTVTVDDVEVIDGLPIISKTPWCNAAGNDKPNTKGDFSIVQLLPNSFNWAVEAIPPQKGINRKSDKPYEVESYSSGPRVDFTIARPRWKGEDPIPEQYIPKDLEARVRGNFCKMAGITVDGKPGSGKFGVPTDAEWDIIDSKRPGTRKRLEADVSGFCKSFKMWNGCDENGVHMNMEGTSFAAPVGAGVVEYGTLQVPDVSMDEMRAAIAAACKPQTRRQGKDDITLDDITHVVDPKTGFRFAPSISGHGSFRYDEGKDNSTELMVKYLKLMQAERQKLTRRKVTVTAGSGATEHEAVLDGQPDARTLKFWNLKDTPSDAMKKRVTDAEAEITAAFKGVFDVYKIPAAKSDPIMAKVKERLYKEALEQLQKEVPTPAFKGLEGLPKLLGGFDPAPLLTSITSLPLQKAATAVRKAQEMEEHTYTFKVPPNCDSLCTVTSLYLKFQDKADAAVILESPDGRRIPVTMADATRLLDGTETPGVANDVKKTVAGRTSGFMNSPAVGKEGLPPEKQGVWKLHTTHALKIDKDDGSRIFQFGSRRDVKAGELSVVETVMLPILAKEGAARTKLEAKNILKAEEDPHVMLRRVAEEKWTDTNPAKVKPASVEEQHKFMEEFIRKESELYKNGDIPKDFRFPLKLGNLEKGTKTSRLLDLGSPFSDVMMDAAIQLSALVEALPKRSQNRPIERLENNWGSLAARAAGGDITLPELSANNSHDRKGRSWHDTEGMTPWQKRRHDEQVAESRAPSTKRG